MAIDIKKALIEASVDGLRKRTLKDDTYKTPNYDDAISDPDTGLKYYVLSEEETASDSGGGNTAGTQGSDATAQGASSTAGAGAATGGTQQQIDKADAEENAKREKEKQQAADDAVRKSSKTGAGVKPKKGGNQTKYIEEQQLSEGVKIGDVVHTLTKYPSQNLNIYYNEFTEKSGHIGQELIMGCKLTGTNWNAILSTYADFGPDGDDYDWAIEDCKDTWTRSVGAFKWQKKKGGYFNDNLWLTGYAPKSPIPEDAKMESLTFEECIASEADHMRTS